MKKETKKGPLKLDRRNYILAQSLRRLPQTDHIQGLGKFISPTKYFHTVHAHSNHVEKSGLYAWNKSIESQME